MGEAAIAVGVVACLLALALLPAASAWQLGTGLIVAGLAVGVPSGVAYHLRLARALAGRLPKGWIWDPVALHSRLDAAQRVAVSRAFVVGAVACGACFVGSAFALVAIVRWGLGG